MEENKIILALEKIHDSAKNSEMNLDNFSSIVFELKLICDYFQINENQAILLAISFINSCFEHFDTDELLRHLNIKKHKFLKYLDDFSILCQKSILKKKSCKNDCKIYQINNQIQNYIVSNLPIPQEFLVLKVKEISFNEFLLDVERIRDEKLNNNTNYIYFLKKYADLLDENIHFKIVKYAISNLNLVDSFVFFNTILDTITTGRIDFSTSIKDTVDDFYDSNKDVFNYMNLFLEGKTTLTEFNLIEKNENTFANKHRVKLTEKAVTMLKELEGISFEYVENKDKRLLYPEQIPKRKLIYNTEEELQIKPINKSLSHKSLIQLQKRLKSNNMSTGITTLLYGASGTGKTETVYQLAKKYNRPVFKVEISEAKSMWFGESQKLVKKIFTDYYNFKKNLEITPILLLNEADALIGKRKSANSLAVSDTENAIQNILLEELENFDGILFATTNLVANIDSAFERRFLYKIKFENPCNENASKIWKNKLPMLSTKQSLQLASQFSFSGGEMENIARKSIMSEILNKTTPNFENILSYCENEKWKTQKIQNKIGY